MADPNDVASLSVETAEVLLEAIKEAAPSATRTGGAAGLKSLAEAYALVQEARPKRSGRSL